MKSYTDLKQSKELAEILPINSADMCYDFYYCDGGFEEDPIVIPQSELGHRFLLFPEDIPCWSLAALVTVLPPSCDDGQHYFALINNNLRGYTEWLCCYEDRSGNLLNKCYADNPVDACVEMIFILKEKDLI